MCRCAAGKWKSIAYILSLFFFPFWLTSWGEGSVNCSKHTLEIPSSACVETSCQQVSSGELLVSIQARSASKQVTSPDANTSQVILGVTEFYFHPNSLPPQVTHWPSHGSRCTTNSSMGWVTIQTHQYKMLGVSGTRSIAYLPNPHHPIDTHFYQRSLYHPWRLK